MVMAAMAAQSAMISTIPVVVTGGIVMKFAEASMPGASRRRVYRRQQSARRRARNFDRRTPAFGNFDNVGF